VDSRIARTTLAGASGNESLPEKKGDRMKHTNCVTYRTNWEIFKSLLWLNLWLLKLLMIWAQFMAITQG
jgi:hypothetical protein